MKEFKEYKAEKDATNEALSGAKRAEAIQKFKELKDKAYADVISAFDKAYGEQIEEAEMAAEAIKTGIEEALSELGLKESKVEETPLFIDYKNGKNTGIEYLNESENQEVDRWVNIWESEEPKIDEGFLTKLVGGAAGFIVGPTVGKIIARALGIEKGILYDMFTSKLVTTALGLAIAKSIGGEYKK